MRDVEDVVGFLFLYTRHIYPLNLEHGTKKKKKKTTSTNSSYNAVHINYCSYLLIIRGVCCRRLAASTPLDPRGSGGQQEVEGGGRRKESKPIKAPTANGLEAECRERGEKAGGGERKPRKKYKFYITYKREKVAEDRGGGCRPALLGGLRARGCPAAGRSSPGPFGVRLGGMLFQKRVGGRGAPRPQLAPQL